MTVKSEKLTFPGSQGHGLAARLDRPEVEPAAYALFAHCFTCGKDVFAAQRIATTLAERGIAVLRFDFTGLGHSDGEFANTNFSSNVADLVAAADHLRREYAAPQLLIGHSLGGAAVIAAAPKMPEARAVATIAAPADPEHVGKLFTAERAAIESEGEAEVDLAGRKFRIRKQFLDDIQVQSLDDALGGLRKALMVFHGPRDAIVGIDNATHIFTAAKHPKSFVSLDDADHLLSRKADASYVAQVLGAWAARYIEVPPAERRTEVPPAMEGGVVVQETGEGRFTNAVVAGRHRLRADEPVEVGGTDTGPSPYDYLLAGLGACSAMTVRLYAERKGWPVERVTVRLTHDKIHADDCADCETREGKVDVIHRRIAFDGALDETQRKRLLEIADKCPVHRTLTSEVRIHTEPDSH
ncbi:alpha/beta fold hydrolase [Ferruginivarius sediminum]|uniref:Alpha/beta fold hydrolase n=1 Tax=Ferruginivarius sediminum TaxID=2661937 RepID=A0A369TF54_9PROT|nr:alpha/beta fold hydrolase [Ferruginivarius sediminum]RDD63898.1 alpha/beta fold hydrolase [Ferruginivarius sediminum]